MLGSSNKLVSENPEMADISHQPQAEVLQGMNCYEWPMSASDTRFDEMHTVLILLLIPSCSEVPSLKILLYMMMIPNWLMFSHVFSQLNAKKRWPRYQQMWCNSDGGWRRSDSGAFGNRWRDVDSKRLGFRKGSKHIQTKRTFANHVYIDVKKNSQKKSVTLW